MDPTTATYYRAILFNDGQDQRPLPQTLLALHAWTFKRSQAMGLGSIITKQIALNVALTWLSSVKEGREFARECTSLGELFDDEETEFSVTDGGGQHSVSAIDWTKVEPGTQVVVADKGATIYGTYVQKKSNWITVNVAGEEKSFRSPQVQLGGA
jgi:hypothetical protein